MENLAQLVEKFQFWLILLAVVLGVINFLFNIWFLVFRRNALARVKTNLNKIKTLEFQMYSLEGLTDDLSQKINGRGFMTNETNGLDISDAISYNNRGIELFDNKEYEQAVESFENAIALDNKYSLAFYNLGNAYLHLGLYDQALENFTKALRLDTKRTEIYYNRAMAFVALKDYSSAVSDLNEVIKLSPNDVQALIMLGNLYKKQDSGRAIEFFDRAITANPFAVEGYINRGKIYMAFKDFDEARSNFRKVLEIDPHNDQAGKQLAIINQINNI